MLKKRGRNIMATDLWHSILGPALDPVETARESFLEPSRLDRIRCRREPLREQAQFFGAKAIALAFEHGQFGGFQHDLLASRLACHDAASGERLPHKPMVDSQCAFDDLSPL